MHHKAIKAEIRKQLKIQYPHWQRLTKKEKKGMAKKVLDEVVNNHDFKQVVTTPLEVLLGIESQLPTASIMNLDEMERFIEGCNDSILFKLNRKKRHPLHIKDEELRFIDELLDDKIINKLLSYDGYSPAMRDFFQVFFCVPNYSKPSSTRRSAIVNSAVMITTMKATKITAPT
jgi:hypothetical protein